MVKVLLSCKSEENQLHVIGFALKLNKIYIQNGIDQILWNFFPTIGCSVDLWFCLSEMCACYWNQANFYMKERSGWKIVCVYDYLKLQF